MKGGLNVFYMQVILISTFAIICVCVLIDTIYSYIKITTSNTQITKEDFDDIHYKNFCKSLTPTIIDRLRALDNPESHYYN